MEARYAGPGALALKTELDKFVAPALEDPTLRPRIVLDNAPINHK